ncbi:MAG: metallophosphatase [Bacteroidaceae bacterium]|nr:metallophosphatase [Bacteroidaceae bacterium]
MLWCASIAVAQEKTLFLVHTNDTHSCVEPISPNHADSSLADKGGFVRRTALVSQLRRAHPEDMMLFDCGDFSQGSLYYNIFRGEAEVKLMNLMGYDACAIGNHEFDCGLENLARLIRMADFPFVCSNYDFSGTPCEGLVQPYAIMECNGLRVGVVGVSPRLEGLVSGQSYGSVRYRTPAKAVQPIVDKLRNEEKCDFIVCLSHLGWAEGEDYDIGFVRKTHGIDVLLGGHTHFMFDQPKFVKNSKGEDVPCNQMGKHGRFVGTMTFVLEPYSK